MTDHSGPATAQRYSSTWPSGIRHMQRIAVAAAVCFFAGLLSPSSRAQSATPPSTEKGFSYCSVYDTAGRKVWASRVFEVEYASGHSGDHTADMANDFQAFVGGMGGAGDARCAQATSDHAEVEASRDGQRSIVSERFVGPQTHQWRDVDWAPKPWAPARVTQPGVVSKYFYCYATDTDQPGTLASTVASPVFEVSVDESDPMALYTQAQQYSDEFTVYIETVHGLTRASPVCNFKETRAEADAALRDYRKMFSGYRTTFEDVAWTPTGAEEREVLVENAGKPLASATQMGSNIGALPMQAPASTRVVPAAGTRPYCYAFIQVVGTPGGVSTAVWQSADSDGSQLAMTATLTAFAAHMRRLQPETWRELTASPVQCDMEAGFCFASDLRRIGESQLAGQFCKATRAEAETQWTQLIKGDRQMVIASWPVAE